MRQFLRNAGRWLPGAIVSLLLIAGILHFVDLSRVAAAVRAADYRLLGVSLLLSFGWLFVRAVVWRTLLRDRPTYRDTMLALSEGYLLNNFLPFRLGEIGRAFMLSRRSGMAFSEILPTIVIERAMDLFFTAVIFLSALPFVVGIGATGQVAVYVGAAILLGVIVLYVLARNQKGALDLFHRLSTRWPTLQERGGGLLESFLTGLGVLTNGWLFVRFLIWMIINWSLAAINYFLLMRAYFPQTQFVWAMFGLGAAAFGGAVPSLPGAVGTFEGALGGALTLLTGDQSTALAVALTARLFNYVTSILVGGYALSREGETISGVYKQLLNLRSRSESHDPTL
jgi:hypothetical protein